MASVAHLSWSGRGQVEGHTLQCLLVPAPLGVAQPQVLLHPGELVQPQRRLQVHHVVLEARDDARVVVVTGGREPLPGVGIDPMEPEYTHAGGQRAVIRHRHPSFARDDVLRGVEGEAGHVPVAGRRSPVDQSFEAVCGILDELQAVPIRNRPQQRQVRRPPGEMHRHDRLRAGGDRRLERVRGEALGVLFHVDEDRPRADVEHDVCRGAERQCGHDHLVTRPDAQRQERQVQRRRARIRGDGVLHANVLRDRALERLDFRTGAEPSGPQGVENLVDLRLPDVRLAEYDVRLSGIRQGKGGHVAIAMLACGAIVADARRALYCRS